MAPIEITTELLFNQPPTSRRFLIPDSTSCVLPTDQLCTTYTTTEDDCS